ncbi:MAG: DNA topoisomerase IV subunit A [Rhodospirillaceae bacterium]|nr:DNA topoisomerase IV subunit A [Alphaproteobacteria bacterium]MBR72170.1 DNA topoisomerase IV subunit A [Rhodospirillaceae bacterium]|tara:strand:+ start:20525 stop:22747 length:2223 start_codon:yes stop_codon:yes gene_type:complete
MTEIKDSSGIHSVTFADALGERYLAYALSTITSRSLPDVRDGLKPVQRRLLYAMLELKLDPHSGHKKCARVVGDVIGKFHPHGDTAVYDALVRLAQSFAVRWPLVEGHGNFGNIDGDNAAAMRYTEARLTKFAIALLEGISEDAVDFRTTYDGEEVEPSVLPASLPNLLANGATGIAVGLATNIPPHNIEELCDAIILLLKNQRSSYQDILRACPGPDFPTGGHLAENINNIQEAYETGRGSLRLRAKWKVEEKTRGQWQIIVTEIPYQVQKSRLIERIAELLDQKKLVLLGNVRDESAEDIRLVLEPKSRGVKPEHMMEMLFKQTDLEVRFSLNMNVLDANGIPKLMSFREMLLAFIAHRFDVLNRRTRYRLDKILQRLLVLDGYLLVFLNLDAVIKIIREEDNPKEKIRKKFKLNDNQAEAILNMRLRSLRKLDEVELRKEYKELKQEQQDLNKLQESKARQKTAIRKEILKAKEHFGSNTSEGKRKTKIVAPPKDLNLPVEAIIEKESVTIICSKKGWIRAIKGHIQSDSDIRYKDGDSKRFSFYAETTDKLILFATNGRFYTINVDKLPGGRGFGEPLRLMADIGNDHDIVSFFVHYPNRTLLVASSDGRGFLVDESSVLAHTKAGKQVLNVVPDTDASFCVPAVGDTVAVVGTNRRLLTYPIKEIPFLSRGRGVILQRFRDGSLSDIKVYKKNEGLSWPKGKGMHFEVNMKNWVGKRGQSGRLIPRGFPRSNKFS